MAGQKILILEDDANSAAMYAEALQGAGNEVTVCTTFKQAREHLSQSRPDALLADVRVGEYNGLHLATLFRNVSQGGTIVVVSGYDDPVIRNEAKELSAEFFLKPVSLSSLTSWFSDAVSGSGRGPSVESRRAYGSPGAASGKSP